MRVAGFFVRAIYPVFTQKNRSIRGGFFVSGVSGEQFALPEAVGLLRSVRKTKPAGELISLSGADPLNLEGIITPGPRLPATTGNRILLRENRLQYHN